MGRYVGSAVNNNHLDPGGGSGGADTSVKEWQRASGITTDANNNVTEVEFGNTKYKNVLYDSVGLITSFTESINGTDKSFIMEYDANNLVSRIKEVSGESDTWATLGISTALVSEGSFVDISITAVSADIASDATLYWDVSTAYDFDTPVGVTTLSSGISTFSVSPKSDSLYEINHPDHFTARVYTDAARIERIGETVPIAITDDTGHGAGSGGGGGSSGSQSNPAVSAKEMYDAGERTNGYYWIKGNGSDADARQIYCIMEEQWGSGGGWMVIANHDASKYANTSGGNHQPRPTTYSSDVGYDGNNGTAPSETNMKPEISFSVDCSDLPYTKVMHLAYDNSGMSTPSTNNWLGLPHIYWCSTFNSAQTMPSGRAWSQQFNNYGVALAWNGSTLNRRHQYSDYNCEGWGVWNASGQGAPYRNGSNNSAQYDPVFCATFNYTTNGASETTSWHDTGNYGYDDWQDGSGQGDGWYVENTGSKQNARDKPSMLVIQ
tara:strand:- start:569 stop:2047 length:1479 start_codon:yes stop_codon:yes gene_type:complete